MGKNKLIVSAAGSGKTTKIVEEALQIDNGKVLITTYTIANEIEIKKKIIELKKCIPKNITIQTWFSFLLQHGVRPFQGSLYENDINGLNFVQRESAQYIKEENISKHYFDGGCRIYSDKISKFAVKCDVNSNGNVIDRLSRIFSHIFIDEVQDLASYDLDFLKLIFNSNINITLVGDPRQVTYLTHHANRYKKYMDGKILDFIQIECKKIDFEIDKDSLNKSYRNNSAICNFSAKLYPTYLPCNSEQNRTTEHDGIFFIRKDDIKNYIVNFNPVQLRYNKEHREIIDGYPVMNFGESKGLTFDRVLIYPTTDMIKWTFNNNKDLAFSTRAKFYVAITRAKYSVGIIYDYTSATNIDGITNYLP